MFSSNEHVVRSAFEKWFGSDGQVWEYAAGHGTLLIRFFRPNSQSSLYVQCKGCLTVRFASMGWKKVNLQLREKMNPEQNDEDFKFEVADGERFYATCWGLGVLETEKIVFIDWPPESRIKKENRILI